MFTETHSWYGSSAKTFSFSDGDIDDLIIIHDVNGPYPGTFVIVDSLVGMSVFCGNIGNRDDCVVYKLSSANYGFRITSSYPDSITVTAYHVHT